ncbi:DUF2334 domain-containing protein [Candidatus Magnetomoraceae bacterium gMMP-1]
MKKIIRRFKEISYNKELKQVIPEEIVIEKAKWYNFHAAPVVLMIDDLTNTWFHYHNNEKLNIGEDWGQKCGDENSAMSFLKHNFLLKWPYVKITLFAVMGKMSSFSNDFNFTNARCFDEDENVMKFYNDLVSDNNIEIAYHGYNHGFVNSEGKFVQEWKAFKDIATAIAQTHKGINIYRKVFGHKPYGGKYGGYAANQFSDTVIDRSGFMWWCRKWTPRLIGQDYNKNYYEPKYFGKNMLIDIPSTVHGRKWTKKQIDTLIKEKQIISIQEHIAYYRPHTDYIQKPNIIEDIYSLNLLFEYLQKKNIWYATITEIAKYYDTLSKTTFFNINNHGFEILYTGKFDHPVLTLRINCRCISTKEKSKLSIIMPDGSLLPNENISYEPTNCCYIINLLIESGFYKIKIYS